MRILLTLVSVGLSLSMSIAFGQTKYTKAEYDRWVKSQEARGSWVMPYSEWRAKMESIDNYKPSQPSAPPPQAQPVHQYSGRLVGQAYDRAYNGLINLYDSQCEVPQLVGQYPLWWDAKTPSGDFLSNGCYSANQQTEMVTMIGPNLKPITMRFSDFGQGSSGSVGNAYNGFRDFILRWNDNVNTQRQTIPPVNSNRMNCTPDGRGGFNCR